VTKSLFLVEISHGMAYDRTNAFTDRSWWPPPWAEPRSLEQ
jgi:hypothetical protein